MTKITISKSIFTLVTLGIFMTLLMTVPNTSYATIEGFLVCTGANSCSITTSPPNPVVKDPNDGILLVWNEVQNQVLTDDLRVDRVADPNAPFIIPDGNGYKIIAGTIVSSHYVQWDPGAGSSSKVTATLDFDSDIFAFITADQKMFDSDTPLGLPGLDYNDFGFRGLEGGDITTINGDKVDIEWNASSPGDWTRLITAFSPSAVEGGSVFLTCHDPDFHASLGGNTIGARNLLTTGIDYITDPLINPFTGTAADKILFVESRILVPPGHTNGVNGMTSAGYVLGTDFEHHDASTLDAELDLLGTKYNAIVIASDFGGILTQAELDILNARALDIITFINNGGGVYAMAESNLGRNLTPDGGHFGFLPFVVSSTGFNQGETGIVLTPLGDSLGLLTTDVNGNASHCIFDNDAGLGIVDLDSSEQILTLASRILITDSDGDGIDDVDDNCPLVPNTNQSDIDGDGIGDVCDATPNGDNDGDGIDNLADNCPDVFNPDQADSNGNGIGDVCENTAPVAIDNSISTDEDTPINDLVTANDAEDDPLTFMLVDNVSNGILVLDENDGTFTYTPNVDFNGFDSFTFIANDGELNSNVGTIFIDVIPVNDAPVCTETFDAGTLWPPNHKMKTVNVSLEATDVDGDELSFTILSIFQDEPLNAKGNGDGNTSPDAEIIDNETVKVRAERAGTENGRVYHITVQADDGEFSCTGTTTIGVPHDKKDTPIDDGPTVNSIEE